MPLQIKARVVKIGDKIIQSESLCKMAEVASGDDEYRELINFLEKATPFSEVDSESSHRQLKKQWDQLAIYEVSPGQKTCHLQSTNPCPKIFASRHH